MKQVTRSARAKPQSAVQSGRCRRIWTLCFDVFSFTALNRGLAHTNIRFPLSSTPKQSKTLIKAEPFENSFKIEDLLKRITLTMDR